LIMRISAERKSIDEISATHAQLLRSGGVIIGSADIWDITRVKVWDMTASE